MWKFVSVVFFTLFSLFLPHYPVDEITIYQEEAPPYAKWGRVAMNATKKKYPDADIVDYLHIGAEAENGITTEKFKLWLRGKEREFGVYIDIRFYTETEEMIDITFTETDR